MRPGWWSVPEELAYPLGTLGWCTQWVRLALATLGTGTRERSVALMGKADFLGAMSSGFPDCPCSVSRGESQLCRRQLMPSTRPRMSSQPRFALRFSENLLCSRSCLLVPVGPIPPHLASSLSQATEDQMRLLRLQRRLEDELGGRFVDLSLHDTVTTLVLGGHSKRAEQLARDFRIPDKR